MRAARPGRLRSPRAGASRPLHDLVADTLATDGRTRSRLLASVEKGTFADEVAVVANLTRPVALLSLQPVRSWPGTTGLARSARPDGWQGTGLGEAAARPVAVIQPRRPHPVRPGE
ncbi:hypothetical protein GCM10010254_24340 [Streptomyces chromofuscus]|nr:hypothetical protein GCM10010254_24340 [Streptomyces chromofuscus]